MKQSKGVHVTPSVQAPCVDRLFAWFEVRRYA